MIALIADNMERVAALCREYGIRKLDLFGSAATGSFDPETSDIDLIADLGGYEPGVARRFYRFTMALEELFGRRVDILTEPMIRNPYFRQSVERQRMTIYEARNRQAVA